jgi:hypothetical protein
VTFVGLSISPGNPTLVISTGTEVQLHATARFSDGSTRDRTADATWISSDPAVISFAGTAGLALGGSAAGTATISASDAETGGAASITVVVTEAVVTSIVVESDSDSTPAGYGVQFRAMATYSDTTGEPPLDITDLVEWSSTSPEVATVSNDPVTRGVATGVAPGQTTITATVPGGLSAPASLTVTAALLRSIAVEPVNAQPDSIPTGFPVQLRATATFSDETTQDVTSFVAWATSDVSVAEVSNADGNRGVVTGRAVGQATITAASGSVSGSIDLNFTAAQLVSLKVSASPGRPWTWSGTTTRFTAEGTFSDDGILDVTRDVTWTISADIGSFSTVLGKENHLLAVVPTQDPITITATHASTGVNGSFGWERVKSRSR